MTDYWQECVATALDEAGVKATPGQVDKIAGSVECGHENYGMAHGHDCIPNPMIAEKERAVKNVRDEAKREVADLCQKIASLEWQLDSTYNELQQANQEIQMLRAR
tara:strand:- start:90 stop:407 length:318 start_codon:yes stop_codon:yes gene_type:complete